MLATILFSVIIIAVAIAIMAVKIIFVKGGKFPGPHAHDSAALRKKGVKCASKQID
ncbi:MAG: hypothetical protein HUK12_08520 [Muribaculaceae bacterium]|nr:hypothetical protein [Muribaculaceae bacterium]